MGIDFIRKAAETFKKSWDSRRVELATPGLFTQQPTCGARIAAADIIDNATLRVGDLVIVRLNGTGLVAMQGLNKVAIFTDPSGELVDAVRAGCGVANGKIEQIHNVAGVAEISIC